MKTCWQERRGEPVLGGRGRAGSGAGPGRPGKFVPEFVSGNSVCENQRDVPPRSTSAMWTRASTERFYVFVIIIIFF